MEPSRGEVMSSVLIDACGWVALVDARLNLDVAMASVAGSPRLLVLDSVNAELQKLSQTRGGLLLDLLEQRSERMSDIEGMKHTCLLYTSPSPRDVEESRMPSSA